MAHGIGVAFDLDKRISEGDYRLSVSAIRGFEFAIAPNKPLIRTIIAVTENPTKRVRPEREAVIDGLGISVVEGGILFV
jgi:hypothetical protein